MFAHRVAPSDVTSTLPTNFAPIGGGGIAANELNASSCSGSNHDAADKEDCAKVCYILYESYFFV